MIKTAALALVLCLAAGCKHEHEGPYTPADLYDAAAAARSAADDIYGEHVAVSGPIAKVIPHSFNDEYQVWLDAGGGNTVVVTYLHFDDGTTKKLAAGQQLSVTGCHVTKPQANKLWLRDCV